MAFDRTRPFVLLDDARPGGAARVYHRPHDIIVATRPDEVRPALDRLRDAVAAGGKAAGFLSYEAGAALEPRLSPVARAGDGPPLLWFGLFDAVDPVDAAKLGDPAGVHVGPPIPRVSPAAHAAAVARILALIAAGDIYQANLTSPCDVAVTGDPLALHARLRQGRAGWGGVVFTGDHWLISASPELFFTLEGGIATARPMKGTAPRHTDPTVDAAIAAALRHDPKQRAENLMIVDLIRNDLARVAAPGGVAVPALFQVETYPTVHHMTSTVTARLAPGRDGVDVLAALFPCGSITGAPKIRAMEVIEDVEQRARGVYTGAIGALDGEGRAAFNVAIRTLVMADGADHATLGLGSAIVADSVAADEWAECLVKGRFVTEGARPFDLIETMAFEPLDGFVDLERHLARMKASADALGFRFDRHHVRNELQAASFRLRGEARVRLRLGPSGATAIEVTAVPTRAEGQVTLRIVPLPVAASDFRLRHKTTDRAFYDDARAAAGTFEVLFADAHGFLTEGSFTSLFVARGGRLLTPPLSRGLLPGVLRERLIEEGRAVEAELRADDLADGLFIGNALRGLMPGRLVAEGAPLPL